MKPGIFRSFSRTSPWLGLCLAVSLLGCTAGQLSADGTTVVMLDTEPAGCENLGVVTGHGGGLSGAYSKPRVNQESAENDARNKAAERGATHLLLYPEDVAQGDGRAPDEKDTAPAMAHGYGTGSSVTVAGTAYKCALDTPAPKTAMSIQAGTAFVEVKAPTSISMAPLGDIQRIKVYQRLPQASGTGTTENEVLVVEDPAQIQRVVDSLTRVAQDPMKYIPTHRVEIAGALGVQSLLYGFGYLQYAGGVYRLTNGDFEEVLKLREGPAGPEVEAESAAPEAPAAPAPTAEPKTHRVD